MSMCVWFELPTGATGKSTWAFLSTYADMGQKGKAKLSAVERQKWSQTITKSTELSKGTVRENMRF